MPRPCLAWPWLVSLLSALLLSLFSCPDARAQARLEVRTEDGNTQALPLVDERIEVRIDHRHATMRLRHVFQNESDARVEGRYGLRLGEGATVTGFAYWNGEQRIVGEVYETQTAREVYQEVTGLGRDPGLLEQEGEGSFGFRVFPIEPGEKKRVEVRAERPLAVAGGRVELRLPLDGPRARVTLDVVDESPIVDLSSPTHELDVERLDARHVRLSVGAAHTKASGFVLRYRLDLRPWTLSAVAHRDPGQPGFFSARLPAPLAAAAAPTPKDITLVLDVSGSMAGEPLENAKRAAEAVVARLTRRDRVNVLAFDDQVRSLHERPREATRAVREEARRFVQGLGHGGGTDIAAALRAALAAQRPDDHPDLIVFLTDGQSDARAALKAARADPGDARVFTVGLGGGVDRALLSRLAKDKRGWFTYIADTDALEPSLQRLYTRIEKPLLVDVSLQVEGARLERLYPSALPDVFAGDELRFSGRLVGGERARLIVRGKLGGELQSFETALSLVAGPSRTWVARQWAKDRVDHLLEQVALEGEQPELKDEVTSLGVSYDLVTPYTSFLALPDSEQTDHSRELLAAARERKQRMLAAHPDALALSRSVMPPGDPVLRVAARADARQVTAYFPFGLAEDLYYDRDQEVWLTRFFVPTTVADGVYEVRVLIVEADGSARLATVPYTIDSEEPAFEVEVIVEGETVRVTVEVAEQSREVRLGVVGTPGAVLLDREGQSGRFSGELTLPRGTHQLQLLVTDQARNEATREVQVEVKP